MYNLQAIKHASLQCQPPPPKKKWFKICNLCKTSTVIGNYLEIINMSVDLFCHGRGAPIIGVAVMTESAIAFPLLGSR